MTQIAQLWDAVHHLSFLIVIFISGYCFYRFAGPFTQRPGKMPGIVYSLVMAILYCIPMEIPAFCAYLCGTASAFIALWLTERKNICQKVFLCVTFFALRWISMSMETTIYLSLHRLIIDSPSVASDPKLQFALYIVLKLIDIALSFLFIALSCRLIEKAYRHKHYIMRAGELLLLITPSAAGIAAELVLQYYNAAGAGMDLLRDWLWFAQEGATLCAILATIVLYQRVKVMQEEEKERQLLFGQVEEMRRHIAEVEKLYRDVRSLRHDMGNHIQTIFRLQERGERASAEAYAAELTGRLSASLPEIKSGNPVTDVILSEKSREAREKGIAFKSGFQYPSGTNLDAFDMAVILHNALSNALRAAEGCGGPQISIASHRRKNACVIEIANSYSGEIILDGESGLPVTAKADKGRHGMGLTNIKRTAEKYHGGMEIEYGGGLFRLSVMLMLETDHSQQEKAPSQQAPLNPP